MTTARGERADVPQSLADELAAMWAEHDFDALLSESARHMAPGSVTDWGLAADIEPSVPPISLGGGIPDPATLPRAELLEAFRRALADPDEEPLRYGGAFGSERLRTQLAERASAEMRLQLGAEHFMLTNGAAGGIAAVCGALLDPGDIVITEAPTFSGSVRTFRGHRAEVMTVPIDDEGMDVELLACALDDLARSGRHAKLIYTTSSFHNPTGTMMALERRPRLLELAAQHGTLVLDDDAYGDICFGERPPSLASLSGGRGVITVGTFSKTIATGLRIGWIQAEPEILEGVARVRFDMGNSPLLHRALSEFIASGDFDRHVARMRPLYAEKARVLWESVLELAAPYIECTRPGGGYFLWLKLRDGLEAASVQRAAIKEGVVFPVGHAFFPDRHDPDGEHIRLAYSNASLEDLPEAAARIARACERAAGD